MTAACTHNGNCAFPGFTLIEAAPSLHLDSGARPALSLG
jgi:hypothetical protein